MRGAKWVLTKNFNRCYILCVENPAVMAAAINRLSKNNLTVFRNFFKVILPCICFTAWTPIGFSSSLHFGDILQMIFFYLYGLLFMCIKEICILWVTETNVSAVAHILGSQSYYKLPWPDRLRLPSLDSTLQHSAHDNSYCLKLVDSLSMTVFVLLQWRNSDECEETDSGPYGHSIIWEGDGTGM